MYPQRSHRGSQQSREQARYWSTQQEQRFMGPGNFQQMQPMMQQQMFAGWQPICQNQQELRQQRMQFMQQNMQIMRQQEEIMKRNRQRLLMEQQQQRNQESHMRKQLQRCRNQRSQRREMENVQKIQTRVIDRKQSSPQNGQAAYAESASFSEAKEFETGQDKYQSKKTATTASINSTSNMSSIGNEDEVSSCPYRESVKRSNNSFNSGQSSVNVNNLIDLSPGKVDDHRSSSQTKPKQPSQAESEGFPINVVSQPNRQSAEPAKSEPDERPRVIVDILLERSHQPLDNVEAEAADPSDGFQNSAEIHGSISDVGVNLGSSENAENLVVCNDIEIIQSDFRENVNVLNVSKVEMDGKHFQEVDTDGSMEITSEMTLAETTVYPTVTKIIEVNNLSTLEESCLNSSNLVTENRVVKESLGRKFESQAGQNEHKEIYKTGIEHGTEKLVISHGLESEMLVVSGMSNLDISNECDNECKTDVAKFDNEEKIDNFSPSQNMAKMLSCKFVEDQCQPSYERDIENKHNIKSRREQVKRRRERVKGIKVDESESIDEKTDEEFTCHLKNRHIQDDAETDDSIHDLGLANFFEKTSTGRPYLDHRHKKYDNDFQNSRIGGHFQPYSSTGATIDTIESGENSCASIDFVPKNESTASFGHLVDAVRTSKCRTSTEQEIVCSADSFVITKADKKTSDFKAIKRSFIHQNDNIDENDNIGKSDPKETAGCVINTNKHYEDISVEDVGTTKENNCKCNVIIPDDASHDDSDSRTEILEKGKIEYCENSVVTDKKEILSLNEKDTSFMVDSGNEEKVDVSLDGTSNSISVTQHYEILAEDISDEDDETWRGNVKQSETIISDASSYVDKDGKGKTFIPDAVVQAKSDSEPGILQETSNILERSDRVKAYNFHNTDETDFDVQLNSCTIELSRVHTNQSGSADSIKIEDSEINIVEKDGDGDETERREKEKNYFESMEVEDISPPVSLDVESIRLVGENSMFSKSLDTGVDLGFNQNLISNVGDVLDLSCKGVKDCNIENESSDMRVDNGIKPADQTANQSSLQNSDKSEDSEKNRTVQKNGNGYQTERREKEKTYIESMEVEDISPPLSLDVVPSDVVLENKIISKNIDTEDGLGLTQNLLSNVGDLSNISIQRGKDNNIQNENSNMGTHKTIIVADQILEKNKFEKEENNSEKVEQTDIKNEKLASNEMCGKERSASRTDSCMNIDTTVALEQTVNKERLSSKEDPVQLKDKKMKESTLECTVKIEKLPIDADTLQRQNSQSSQGSFQEYGKGQSQQTESDEDDDLLNTIPAFLQSVQEISDKPLPSTPDHFSAPSHSQEDNTDGTAIDDQVQLEETKPTLKSRYSLDDLLADKGKSSSEEQKQLDLIHSECKRAIQEGGFITILDQVEEEGTEALALPDENQQILNQLNAEESQISDDRPGRLIFDSGAYCSLFDESLHPTHCGFTVGTGKFIEKHLESLQLEQYQRLLTTSIVQVTFEKIQCQGQLMRWLFFLMSVHSDYKTRHGCHKILMDIVQAQRLKGKQKTWSPALSDVLIVFTNYGATLDTLLVPSNFSQDSVQIELYSQPNYNPSIVAPNHHGYRIDNLLLVLDVLAYILKDRSSNYSASELTVLLTVLMTVSLDTKLKSFCAFDAFHICVHTVLHQYLEADWNDKKISMCRLISKISSHHHDKLVLAKLLPPDARGSYLQRRTSALMLEDLSEVDEKISDEDLDSLQIQNLYKFVSYMKELVYSDSYKLSSVISLLDLGVGNNSSLNSTEREELRTLVDQVKRLSNEVRDDLRMLDRTRVKDMMFRVTSRWSLDIQATKGKQAKIFEFVKQTPREIKLETVQVAHSNEDSSESYSESDSDDEQEHSQCKMQRLDTTVVPPSEGNPTVCDGSSHLGEADCFKQDMDKDPSDISKLRPEADMDLNDDDANDDDLPEL